MLMTLNGKIGATRLFLLSASFLALYACERSSDSASVKESKAAHVQNTQSKPGHGAKPSNKTKNIYSRAKYIRKQIEKYKEWGGHAAVAQRVVTAKTFARVRQEIGPQDSPALIVLLQDDAEDIRAIATSLLDCVDPNAQSIIREQISRQSNGKRQDRLRDALIQIRVIRAGGTSCK